MLDLFTRIEIKKIVVDVRADGPAASLAGWWSNSYLPKPEVWIGGLTRPRIGLDASHWDRLTGNVPPSQHIHAIIHNDALVN